MAKQLHSTDTFWDGCSGWIYAILLASLLIVLPFFLIVVLHGNDEVDAENGHGETLEASHASRILFMPTQDRLLKENENDRFIRDNACVIYKLLELFSPWAHITPDGKYGYAVFFPKKHKREIKPDEPEIASPVTDGMGKMMDSEEESGVASVAETFSYAVNDYFIYAKILEEKKGAFWINDRGQLLENPPEMDSAYIMQQLEQAKQNLKENLTLKKSCLEVISPADDEAESARVVIRESSGIAALDEYAALKLRRYIRQARMKEQKFPLPHDRMILFVLWKY